MSMTRMFTIKCDGCGNDGDDEGLYGPYSSDVREDAQGYGWRIGNKDYCPDCVAKMSCPTCQTPKENIND
jgi:hypothetical protein